MSQYRHFGISWYKDADLSYVIPNVTLPINLISRVDKLQVRWESNLLLLNEMLQFSLFKTFCDSSSLLVGNLMSFFLFAVYGNWRFIRSCAFLGSPGEGTGNENFCTMRTGTYNVFMETCTCNSKDGCNTTSTLSSWSSLLLLFVSITFYVFDTRLLWCWHWPIMEIRPVSGLCVPFYSKCVSGKHVFSSINKRFGVECVFIAASRKRIS